MEEPEKEKRYVTIKIERSIWKRVVDGAEEQEMDIGEYLKKLTKQGFCDVN